MTVLFVDTSVDPYQSPASPIAWRSSPDDISIDDKSLVVHVNSPRQTGMVSMMASSSTIPSVSATPNYRFEAKHETFVSSPNNQSNERLNFIHRAIGRAARVRDHDDSGFRFRPSIDTMDVPPAYSQI